LTKKQQKKKEIYAKIDKEVCDKRKKKGERA